MSLITRCPACGTMFKVVPDQLRISEGWVRCGQCSEVFDATANMQAEAAPAVMPAPAAELAHEGAPANPHLHDDALVAGAHQRDEAPPSEAFASSLHTEVGEDIASEPSDSIDSIQLREEAEALREGPPDRPFVLQRQEAPAPVERPVAYAPESELEPEPELHEVSFVRQARRREFWNSPLMRAFLLLAFFALTALLVLQLALHDRDRLAASDPGLRPWLAKLCEPLRCIIRAPHQIDALAIDSSSFNKLRADTFRLNVTLKNQATIEVAMPALELTLTDAQDQAVIRRVLLPGDIQPQPGIIGPGADWSGSVAVAVAGNGSNPRIAGYRLLAFYP